jgi:Xaa-Pro aminopeptidase
MKVTALRKIMKEKGIDCYIVPSFDAHQSEYVSDYFKSRAWITGFTGSAGTAVITQDAALLWTDGRYHTQAEKELAGGPFQLVRQGLPGEATIEEWLVQNMGSEAIIGFDGSCVSKQFLNTLEKQTEGKGFQYSFQEDLFERVWINRPAFPKEPAMDFPVKFAGESRLEKLSALRAAMVKKEADAYLIPNLDDIAWLLNIRGNDMTYCPFVIAYVLVTLDQCTLFIHSEKLSQDVEYSLFADGISLMPYDHVFKGLNDLTVKTVIYDAAYTSVKLVNAIPSSVITKSAGEIVSHMKSNKSKSEIQNMRHSQLKDGVALIHFLKWLYGAMVLEQVTELDIAAKLEHYRRLQEHYIGPSFNTIAGYKENAAMMHYSATEEKHAILQNQGLLLIDSGAQYLDGTTDITRTVALGPLTEEERKDYTLTLKSHIGLAEAVFLKGTCGPHLDILARKPMWDNGLDYKCGTGHGIGYFLSVHEGPHTIRCNQNDVPLAPGMIITNEPGVYKPGRHGVRIENVLLVSEYQTTEFGEFYHFDTLSFCPIDKTPIIKDMLTPSEIKWLNDYHEMVWQQLSPILDGEHKTFLRGLTEAL